MVKIYRNQNVYDATQERLKYIFDEFDNIILSFSGGKDSGLLLNIVIDFMREHHIEKKIGLFHQDMEAQYQHTTDYVTEMFQRFAPITEPYWWCIPLATRTAVGNYEIYWYPWDDTKKDIWVRDMPDYPYIFNLQNNPMGDFYKYRMTYKDHAHQFGRWYRQTRGGKTVSLLGIRSDESLMRYSAVANKRHDYEGKKWITKDAKDVYSASPIYDWAFSDIWRCNAEHGYSYNKLYDLFFKAGVPEARMRVASPFSDEAAGSLNLYRALDPTMWARIVGRVNGANFASIYGATKAMGRTEIKLPEGHTWKSYTKFLLATLPKDIRRGYIEKFKTSIRFWHRVGGGLSQDVIDEIKSLGYDIRENGVSNYSKDGKIKCIFRGTMRDDTDDVRLTKDIPSWKRMALCILRNDHMCKGMGFGLTRQQNERRREILAKYSSL